MKTKIITAACISLMLCSTAAMAEKGGHGHKRNEYNHGRYDRHDHDRNVVVINNNDRVVLRQYVYDDYRFHCPHGLAKKHNGCVPPGHAKEMYRIGEPLRVSYEPVPIYVQQRLEPIPYGYRYVMVDRDVLLISEASHEVIDAVTLLSAVGN